MKALIVDDEKHVRDAIRLLGHWAELGVETLLEASDGNEAAAIITAESPELILSDMRMPGKDGMALLEWISTHAPLSKVLVISGYDDFELVRHAIRYGGMDYLLKPVEADELNTSLGKAIHAWSEEEAARSRSARQSIVVNRMRPHYQDRLLTALVTGRANGASRMQQLQDELSFPVTLPCCSLAVTSLSHLDAGILAKYRSQPELLAFSVINIATESINIPEKGVAFRHLEQPDEVVLLYWGNTDGLQSLLKKVNQGVGQTLQRHLHFGISSCEAYPAGISTAYHEARLRLWRRNMSQSEGCLHLSAAPVSGNKPRRVSSMEETWRVAAMSGNTASISAVVADWIEPVSQLEVITGEQLQQWMDEFEWMIGRWLDDQTDLPAEMDVDTIEEQVFPFAELPLDQDGRLSIHLLQSQLEHRLLAAGKTLIAPHPANPDPMSDIARYTEANHKEDLSLQQIAAKFYLSREYISRKFKQQFGVNWSEYLGRQRMNHAKLLLHNPSLRLAQIAEMVGYQDEKYFSKVFKKMEGMTPGEYRKVSSGVN